MNVTDFAAPLGGGLLIGAAAVLLYGTLGRIAGVSGIAYGTYGTVGTERRWRLLFLAGLVGGGWIAALAVGGLPVSPGPAAASALLALGAGLLVGFGTRLGNGRSGELAGTLEAVVGAPSGATVLARRVAPEGAPTKACLRGRQPRSTPAP